MFAKRAENAPERATPRGTGSGQERGMTDRIGPALVKAFRAMADVLESELQEQEPSSSLLTSGVNDSVVNKPEAPSPGEPKRRAERPVYRPQGPIDELSAKRADDALKRRGLLPVERK
jgi:hypothetical protein